jgi:hypothetical protein
VKLDARAPAAPFLPFARSAQEFVRSARRERDWLGLCFAGLIVVHGLCVAAIGVSPAAAGFFMRRFHLQSESFTAWALTAATPWMYNFENRVRISDAPLSAAQLASSAGAWRRVNHQPARVITFADGRARFLARPGAHYFYLETRYRDQVVLTAYVVEVPRPGSTPQPSRMRRIESER